MKILVERIGKSLYRASMDGEGYQPALAICSSRAAAQQKALETLHSAFIVAANPPAMARCVDGTFLIATEVSTAELVLWYFEADGSRKITCMHSSRTIGERTCTLEQFVKYYALMHDGMKYSEAEKLALAA